MAIASLGTNGVVASGTNKATVTTVTVVNSTGATIPVGTLLALTFACDNNTSTSSYATLGTDGQAGSWTAQTAIDVNGSTGNAYSGLWHHIWTIKTDTAITTGADIVVIDVTGQPATAAKSWICMGFSGADNSPTLTTAANLATTVTTSGSVAADDLVIGCLAFEAEVATTGDADTTNGSWSTMVSVSDTAGVPASNAMSAVQYKITTGAGTQTWNPTGLTGSAQDFRLSTVVFPAGVSGTTINGGLAEEADTALAGTIVAGSVVSGGLPVETDTALTGTVASGAIVVGGLATETDAALAGAVSEADFIAGGLASEADEALAGAVTVGTVIVGGLAAETDTALTGATLVPILIAGGLATETDTALAGTVLQPALTQISRAGGRVRLGLGVATWEPPVVAPPAVVAPIHAFVSALAYAPVTMNGTRPVITKTKAETPRLRDRIVVGGHDVTYFRGIPTPVPEYGLIEPLMYGSGTLTLPQVAACFEAPGVGALSWLKKGATVLVQRVNASNIVVATDYKGIIVSFDVSGRELSIGLGGEAAGRASLRDKQPPLFFKREDLGFWWWGAVKDLSLPFTPRLGPDTGIRLRNNGGMSHLDYMLDLAAKGATRAGNQWTCMPNAAGAYAVARKDTTTVHATVYLDDAAAVPQLKRDIAEEPNRVFATGVSPQGMRVKFGAYPVLSDGDAPPYPMDDESDFGIGTTDGDTDTGDGVSVMIWRLVKTGYLSLEDKPGGYDADVVSAIKDLKEDAIAGPTFIDGDMTPEAWRALFDVSATGYSVAGSKILPAAERDKVKQWRRSGSGSVIGRNPGYDPTKLVVDTTVDMGVGMTRKQMREYARAELSPVDANNWVGTITLNTGAVIVGEHEPGDPIEPADLLDARALRPGMNLWAPLFDGGTLLHVSGITRGSDGTVVAAVDTRARDTMKVWEIIQRNRDSRRNPARSWMAQHRSSALTKDAVSEFDEIGGVLDDRVIVPGDTWKVFPVVAGQEGTIRSLRFDTTPAAEYVCAVFGKQITRERLTNLIGDPLSKPGAKNWKRQSIRDRLDRENILLYVAGDDEQPCGFYPGAKAVEGEDGDVDLELLTGLWQDDAGFSYHTFGAPVLWVAVYADRDTRIREGRVMWPQLEAGS